MQQLSTDALAALLKAAEPPCISFIQPTHRHHPDNQQDPIRYRNLLGRVEQMLEEKYPMREVQALLEPFRALAGNGPFWQSRTEALAIFASPGKFQMFELQTPVRELVVVADSFHTKPIIRALQVTDRYQILCLNRKEAKLYEGTRDSLDQLELPNVPATITAALGEELTEPHSTVASYGGRGKPKVGKSKPAMHHGHGQRKDEIETDMVRFFRVIDRAILEHHSRPSGLPLMLAALPEYHTPFREISHNPLLMERGIEADPDGMSLDQMRVLAWQQVEPRYQQRLTQLIENHQLACSRNLGSDDVVQVAQATAAGRVGTLLVESDRVIPGRLDLASGQVEPGDLGQPGIEDVLDELAEAVLRMKGEVVVVPPERMPSHTGLAATYRF